MTIGKTGGSNGNFTITGTQAIDGATAPKAKATGASTGVPTEAAQQIQALFRAGKPGEGLALLAKYDPTTASALERGFGKSANVLAEAEHVRTLI